MYHFTFVFPLFRQNRGQHPSGQLKTTKNPEILRFQGFSGAARQIRTADLILTKDALYLLSYSSKLATRIGLEPTTSSVTG